MTLTIVARNPYTRQLGVAIASGSDDCVGGSLTILPDAGIISVQAKGDRDVRQRAADLMDAGETSDKILETLRAEDTGLDLRQILLAPMEGDFRLYTGAHCLSVAGDIAREHVMIAGNMLASDETLVAMERAYMKDMHAHMRRRLFDALKAGIAAGGDMRGHKSAALIVTGYQPFECVVTNAQSPIELLTDGMTA